LACERECGVEARRLREGEGEGEPCFLARREFDLAIRSYMVALLGDVNA
jgi:hypothetical protein